MIYKAEKSFKSPGACSGVVYYATNHYVLGRLVEKLSQDKEVNDIETRELGKYLAYLMEDGLNSTSVAIHYRVLRACLNWLVSESYVDKPLWKIYKNTKLG